MWEELMCTVAAVSVLLKHGAAFQSIRRSCRSSRCILRDQWPICNIWSLHSRVPDICMEGVWNSPFHRYQKLATSEACGTPLQIFGYVRGVSCPKYTRLRPDLLPLEWFWVQSCYRPWDSELYFPQIWLHRTSSNLVGIDFKCCKQCQNEWMSLHKSTASALRVAVWW
jgi:hypothetical protein